MAYQANIVPFDIINGLDGEPLVNGYVYIGEENLDPITNPVAVFYDAAGTIPAPQPLRTIGGYISRAGAPAKIFVNGTYSILVQTQNNVQVYYSASSTMGNGLSTNDIVFSLPTYDALRDYDGSDTLIYVAGSLNDQDGAANFYAVDESDTTSADNGGSILVDAINRRWKVQEKKMLYAINFGMKNDGTDDTASILNLHTAANALKLPVSYEGLTKIGVQANAQIPLQTSTDFAQAEINIIGGVYPEPLVWGNFDKTFIISDPTTPLVNASGNPAATDLVQGSIYPTRGVFDGNGYALLTCTGFTVPNRAEDDTQSYTQSFNVIRGGTSTQPLSANLSPHFSTATVKYRLSPKTRLKISGVNLLENGWNKLNLLNISRNCVDIEWFTVNFTTDVGYSNFCNLIDAADIADLTITKLRASGMQYQVVGGTYVLQISGGADIRIDDVITASGWGWIGSNNINGLYVSNSLLNRVDGHSSLHNVFVSNSTLSGLGVVYGWGGGVISVDSCKTTTNSCIATRNDYGGCFYGDLMVSNVQVGDFDSLTASLIDMANQPVGAASVIALPRTINISNVTYSEESVAGSSVANILTIGIKAGATGSIFGVQAININNVSVPAAKIPKVTIPYGAMNRGGGSGGGGGGATYSELNICNVASASPLELFVAAAPASPPSPPMLVQANITNVARFSCDWQYPPSYCFIDGGIINKAFSIGSPFFKIKGALFRNFGASTRIGGTFGTTGEEFTSINDCHFYGNFDLSLVGVLQGNTIALGSTTVTLPSGVTNATLFSGWKAATFP